MSNKQQKASIPTVKPKLLINSYDGVKPLISRQPAIKAQEQPVRQIRLVANPQPAAQKPKSNPK